jgi:hypothetical protein
MKEIISILLEALMIVSRDLALYEGQEPSEIAALALFSSSLKARTQGSEKLSKQLKRLEPSIYSVLSEISDIVDSSEN